MDIDVIDANNNCTRPTSNLSGGETFVVSLALALGLASMASNNIKVESLFLDEGFGTLDAASLDIVLDTLANLREEGKTIGIISHVEALKERIDKKITLKTSCGISIIEGDGISSLGDNEKSPKEKKPKTK
jgi:exonuclease SbcC